MKKVLILFSLSLIISLTGYAQNNKRTSAYMYMQNDEYEKALEAINQAIQHPKTEQDSRTWLYRGQIYYNIAIDTTGAYVDLVEGDPAIIAAESFINAKKYDDKDRNANEILNYCSFLANYFYNTGINAYNMAGVNNGNNEKDFSEAVDNFIQYGNMTELINNYDTTSAYLVGMCAVLAKEYDVADEYLQKCIDLSFNEPNVYLYYSRSLKSQSDTTASYEIILAGRELFPENLSLMLEEAQYYLDTNENEKLQVVLNSAIDADPENANLYRVIGQTYENLGDQEKAIESYEKAIELDPAFFEAQYNLAAIYINTASLIIQEANNLDLSEQTKYDEMIAEAQEILKQALPYLEKAYEINPNDQDLINSLKEVYANLKMNEKLEELMDK